MKLETAERIRNKCSIPILANISQYDLRLCKTCILNKKIKLIQETKVCDVITDFLKIKMATENFLIQNIQEENIINDLCEGLAKIGSEI